MSSACWQQKPPSILRTAGGGADAIDQGTDGLSPGRRENSGSGSAQQGATGRSPRQFSAQSHVLEYDSKSQQINREIGARGEEAGDLDAITALLQL
jgi:hypothetical protein